MKTKFLLFLLLVFNIKGAIAQKKWFSLQRPSITQVDSIENKHNGRRISYNYTISVSPDYFPNALTYKLNNSLVFYRHTKPIKTEVSYFSSDADSTIRLIEYTWEGNSKNWKKLLKKFERNKKLISKHFQNPGRTSFKDYINEKDDWTGQTVVWENATSYVKQFLIAGQGTFRTRVLISWKENMR